MDKQQKKITLSREIEADQEIRKTKITKKTALFISFLFGVILCTILCIDLFYIPEVLKKRDNFEDYLKEQTILQKILPAKFQSILTNILYSGNEQAVVGKNGYLFYKNDIKYLTSNDSIKGVSSIIDFANQLKARNIELILMPIPLKSQLYPEMLSGQLKKQFIQRSDYKYWLQELAKHKIKVFDPSSILIQLKKENKNVYLKTDTHWSFKTMQYVAFVFSNYLLQKKLVTIGAENYLQINDTVSNYGDIFQMFRIASNLKKEKQIVYSIINENGNIWQPSRFASILFLGDSFSNIYSFKEMNWGSNGGLIEQLSYYLQRPIDVIRRNDNGSSANRLYLQKELKRGVDRLMGKKVVIWQFAMRELTQGDWPCLSMKKERPKKSEFVVLNEDEEILVQGVISSRSASLKPDKTPYGDHVIAIHLTNVQIVDNKKSEFNNKEAVVYMCDMKKRTQTDVAALRMGESVTLRLEAWQKHESIEGTYNRSELEDNRFLLEEPVWGEFIKKNNKNKK